MADIAIKIENLKKQYRLGTIGGSTLNAELQSWWARRRGKEDPNLKIGEDYSRSGERFWALNGIDLEVHKGEALGIIGANGAGKSTLLKILSRVTAPTEGDVWINGRISSMLEVGTGFHGELTGRENIYMNGAILGMGKKEVDSKMDSIIAFSECGQFIDTPVKRYSSGMYVKLAFAVASHLDSEILVMDEVLAVGDMKFQKKCLGKMGDVAENEGRTVLYVSHNMATIRNLCTRCIVLDKGKIVFNGDVEKAVSIYMDQSSSELFAYYGKDFFLKKLYDTGMTAVEEMELLNKHTARYHTGETMHLRIRWRAMADIKDVRFGISIKYIDAGNIGFAESPHTCSCQANASYESTLAFEISNLAEGIYYMHLCIYTQNEMGELQSIYETDKMYFEVMELDKGKIIWHRQYWGSIRLNSIKLLQNVCLET